MKNAATGFFEAVGAAFSDLGSELRKSDSSDDAGDIRDDLDDEAAIALRSSTTAR